MPKFKRKSSDRKSGGQALPYPQVTQLSTAQRMANDSPQVRQLRALQAAANGRTHDAAPNLQLSPVDLSRDPLQTGLEKLGRSPAAQLQQRFPLTGPIQRSGKGGKAAEMEIEKAMASPSSSSQDRKSGRGNDRKASERPVSDRETRLGKKWSIRTIKIDGKEIEVKRKDAEKIYREGTPHLSGVAFRAIKRHANAMLANHIQKNTPKDKDAKLNRKVLQPSQQQLLDMLPEKLPANQPSAGKLILKHIGTSDGQYISTSRKVDRAATYASRTWTSATVDQGRLRMPEKWSPVIKIDLSRLQGAEGPVYDMTDMTTVAAIVAMETDEGYDEANLNEVLGNAFKDHEVIFSKSIPKSCIVGIETNVNQIAKFAYGPQMEAGYKMLTGGYYLQLNPDTASFDSAIVNARRRPQWAQNLKALSHNWGRFLAGKPNPQVARVTFEKKVEPVLEPIIDHLLDNKNLDREMTQEERGILTGFLQVKANFYNDAKQ